MVRNVLTISSTFGSVQPALRARSAASWFTAPSARGSENGMPSSMMSAPASARLRMMFRLSSMEGSPADTYAINAGVLFCFRFSKVLSIRQFMGDDLQGLVQNGNPFVVLLFKYEDVCVLLGVCGICDEWGGGVVLLLFLLVESG